MDNLFADLPRSTLENEQFCELLARPGLRIERIVSTGQAAPNFYLSWDPLSTSTFLSLLVIPVVFTYVDDAIVRARALLRRRHA